MPCWAREAENVHFVREFIRGNISRDLYKQMVVDLYHVYAVLEELLLRMAQHPQVGKLAVLHAKLVRSAPCRFLAPGGPPSV